MGLVQDTNKEFANYRSLNREMNTIFENYAFFLETSPFSKIGFSSGLFARLRYKFRKCWVPFLKSFVVFVGGLFA